MKVKLVLQPDQFTSFTSWYLESLWRKYFDISIYDDTVTYDRNTLFGFWNGDPGAPIINQLFDNGCKIVVDNLWEKPDGGLDKFYQLNNPNWFWYNESLWWTALGYDQYVPDKTYKKIALMPIRSAKSPRELIVERTRPFHDQMLWSYQDKRLPDDELITNSGDVNQRFMHTQWYDDCCISVVVETAQHIGGIRVSEKSYKPLAFYQPALIVGVPGVLELLKSQGFETFENLFDESYDQCLAFEQRLDIIMDNLAKVTREPYSELTWAKLKHNHNHFFNQHLVTQCIVKEIIEPLLHYAET